MANGDAESLTGFNIVVSGQVRVCQEENTGPDRRTISFGELCRWAGEQAAELHFEKRNPGREPWVSITTLQSHAAGLHWRLNGQAWDRVAFHDARGLRFV